MLIAVSDLDEAAERLVAEHGLASVPGGTHPEWGTANRIVPLGDTYIELIAVVNDAVAQASAFGSFVAASTGGDGKMRPIGWAVRADIEEAAARLDLPIHDGSRQRPDGQLVTWRLAGEEQAMRSRFLPFFIEWGDGAARPGTAPIEHEAGTVELTRVVIRGDEAELEDWLGAHDLPITIEAGDAAVQGVRLHSASGEITL